MTEVQTFDDDMVDFVVSLFTETASGKRSWVPLRREDWPSLPATSPLEIVDAYRTEGVRNAVRLVGLRDQWHRLGEWADLQFVDDEGRTVLSYGSEDIRTIRHLLTAVRRQLGAGVSPRAAIGDFLGRSA